MTETASYTAHYDGSSLTMPFSRRLEVGDTWKDTLGEWRVVRLPYEKGKRRSTPPSGFSCLTSYFVNLKSARWYVPSASLMISCRQVPA